MKSRMPFVLLLYVLQLSIITSVSAQTGLITGKITDSETHEALTGVNIIINELENTGTASDINGRFSLQVPVGSYSIKASMIGYRPAVKTDIIVSTGSEVNITIQLSGVSIGIGEVTVQADYFDKSVMENDVSTIILGPEEVKRSPGSSLDVQRILQGMAGVSFSSDRTNELIVRGGAPDENLVILDNMEIHSINHFPSEYNSGGAINMINIDLVRDMQFSTGGFISKYGDKLSSVMNISTREGTRNKQVDGNINLSLAGAGGVMEGSINNGKGAWLVSARNSFLSLFKDIIGKSGVPVYRDIYFKLAYDISQKHTITSSVIYGWDKLMEDDEPDDSNSSLAGKTDTTTLSYERIKQYQYAAGITLNSIWSKNLYSGLTVYYSNYHFNINETERFISSDYKDDGSIDQSNLLKESVVYNDEHDNGEAVIKGELVYNVDKTYELSFGGAVKLPGYRQKIYNRGDSTRYDIDRNGWNTPDDIYKGSSSSVRHYDIALFENVKNYAFVNNRIKFFNDRLIINLGLRYDYFSYSKRKNISPRFSASYSIIPGTGSVNFAYGDYYQSHIYPLYHDKYKTGVNKHLKNSRARHYLAGYEQVLNTGLKLSVETYYKEYSDIPVPEEFIHYEDRTFRSQRYISTGEKYSYGIDLLLQQKLVTDIFGTLAYSRMWSKFKDPRIGREGKEYSSDYEYPHVLTLIVGKRFSGLRDKLDNMPFYIKYPSYLIPFSNDMEISARWRYASGRVYTPKTYIRYEQDFEGDLRWRKGKWISTDEINSGRYPDYHRLDIAFSSRYNFPSWSLTAYLSIENIYNRKNILRYKFKSDGTIKKVYQFSIFPVVGMEIRF